MRIGVVGDPHGKFPLRIPKHLDFILITGDLGKANLARKRFFENIERNKKGLPKLEEDAKFSQEVWKEIYDSSMNVAKFYAKIAPTYSLIGNVGNSTDYEMKQEEKKLKIKLPHLHSDLKNIKNFHLVRNSVRRVNGLRIGFLEHFLDPCWFKEFNEKDEKKMKKARKESNKAKQVLRWFNKVDILVSHQPPYGILDVISGKYGAPKRWWGKHAGSKVVLDYFKGIKPRYVFCGHIHEGKGKRKIERLEVINAGSAGDFSVVNIN